MDHYTGPLKTMLERLEKTANITITQADRNGEWFLCSDPSGPTYGSYQRLKVAWAQVAGASLNEFAIIHCDHGPDRGLWLHHLGNEAKQNDYLAGVHHVSSWEA